MYQLKDDLVKLKKNNLHSEDNCLFLWSQNFVLLENNLPHIGHATTFSLVWIRTCSINFVCVEYDVLQPTNKK